jgi:hypothetical protein
VTAALQQPNHCNTRDEKASAVTVPSIKIIEGTSTVTIAHQRLASNFTIIANACINDPRLGFEALAIFVHLRSKPGDWVVRPNEIAARFKAGRDRVRKALNQLVECGYIGKAQTRDPATGRLGAVEYVVHVLAEAAPAEVEIIAAPSIAPPSPETPSTVIRSLLSTDLLPSTDSTKKDNIRLEADASDASGVDRGEHAGETSANTGRPLPSSSNRRRSPATFRQSTVEAGIAWRELERLEGWGGTFGEDELSVWHALLRKGYAAEAIVGAAAAFLRKTPSLTPSLGDWLAGFENYLEDEADDAAFAAADAARTHGNYAHEVTQCRA